MSKRVVQGKGFTLIEVLVYVAILVTVSTAGVTLILSLDDVITEYKIEASLYRSATNVLEQVAVALREGETLDVANSLVASSTAGKLTVENGGVDTVFQKVGSDLILTVDGVSKGDLLNNGVNVTNFTVYQYTTAIGTMVRVKLALTTTVGSTTKSTTFYQGAVIRGDL